MVDPAITIARVNSLNPACLSFQFHIIDPDGDLVKCRIATDYSECDDLCVHNDQRPGSLTENCVLEFKDGPPADGSYLVNLVVEDFMPGSDTPLSKVYSTIALGINSMVPGTIQPVSFGPVNETLVLDAKGRALFTMHFDEAIIEPVRSRAFYFIDAYTQEVFYTIAAYTKLGQLQLRYLNTSIEIRPFINFNTEPYQGRIICIIADQGYAASPSCFDQTAPFHDPTLWCFSVGRDECKYGALVNCTINVSPDYCDLLYDPTWGPCESFQACEDLEDGYQCSPLDGYELDPNTGMYIDRDECTNGSLVNCTGSLSTNCSVVFDADWGPCGRNTSCTNLPGSYRCDCLTGYVPDPVKQQSCIALCGQPDGDPHASLVIQDNVLIEWLNEGDVAKYQCELGYHVSAGVDYWSQECLMTGTWNITYGCIDIDECSWQPAPCGEAFCLNLPGAYVCLCLVGQVYDLVTGTCKAFSMSCEFYNVFGYCANGGNCTLLEGKPQCSCPEGYSGPQCEIRAFTLTFILAVTALALGFIHLILQMIQIYRTRRVTVGVVHKLRRIKPVPQRFPKFPQFPFLRRPMQPNYQYPVGSPRTYM